jgi:hypothetical protein
VLEAYWVVLRFAVFPTAIAVLREKVVDYLHFTRVPARDLSLLFGIPTHSCYYCYQKRGRFPTLQGPDLEDRTPATYFELQGPARLINEAAVLWFRDIRDGGAVGHPEGGGPFALDDATAIDRSWGLCALRHDVTLPAWARLRKKMWHLREPWTNGLTSLFGCVQEELLSQWRELPPESKLFELTNREKIVVPQRRRPGPKPRTRNRVLREILSKQPGLTDRQVCKLMDSRYTDVATFPTLARPEFNGVTYNSWNEALSSSSGGLVHSLISRSRPK